MPSSASARSAPVPQERSIAGALKSVVDNSAPMTCSMLLVVPVILVAHMAQWAFPMEEAVVSLRAPGTHDILRRMREGLSPDVVPHVLELVPGPGDVLRQMREELSMDLVPHVLEFVPGEGSDVDAAEDLGDVDLGDASPPSHRVDYWQGELAEIFQALPHGDDGLLEPDLGSYLLRRAFSQTRGWVHRDAAAWPEGAPPAASTTSLGGLFVRPPRLALRGAARLAAALEASERGEALERLAASRRLAAAAAAHGAGAAVPGDDGGGDDDDEVLDIYMFLYTSNLNHSSATPEDVEQMLQDIARKYPGWEATRLWARALRREGPSPGGAASAPLEQLLDRVAEEYGPWQDRDCAEMRGDLSALGARGGVGVGAGRVLLADFYRSALQGGSWQFVESPEYLRHLGVLDESDPAQPRLLVTNYLSGLSNCLAGSRYHTVCCMNRCDALFGELERALATPVADAARLVDAVAQLRGGGAARALAASPALLAERLRDLGGGRTGPVPLHGPAMAQLMHEAFPEECPRPLPAGAARPMEPAQWSLATSQDPVLDAEGLRQALEGIEGVSAAAATAAGPAAAAAATRGDGQAEGGTDRAAELVGEGAAPSGPRCSWSEALRRVMAAAVVLSMALISAQRLGVAGRVLRCWPVRKPKI